MASIEKAEAPFNKGKWIWWRISGPTAEYLKNQFEKLQESDKFDYVFAQYEESSEHGLHLQGIAHSINVITRPTICKIVTCQNFAFGALKSEKDVKAMQAHCEKDETYQENLGCLQYGDKKPAGANSARAEKKSEGISIIATMLKNGVHKVKVREYGIKEGLSAAIIEQAIQDHNYITENQRACKLLAYTANIKWKPWQQAVVDYLQAPIDARSILVVYDKKGNSGKSFLMKHFKVQTDDRTVNLSNGKTGDLMHIIQKKPLVENILINLPRSVHGIVNYQAFEQAKDGEFCSTKYDGQEMTINPTRVVIFTNEVLNWDAMSHDRWRIMTLKGEEFKIRTYNEFIMLGGKTYGIEQNKTKPIIKRENLYADAPGYKRPKNDPEINPEVVAEFDTPFYLETVPDPPVWKPSIPLDKEMFCPDQCYLCDMNMPKVHTRHTWTEICTDKEITKCACFIR